MVRRLNARLLGGLALAALAGLLLPLAQAGSRKSDSVVKAKAAASADGGKQVILVTLDIEPGWHVYANPVGNEDLAPAQTEIKVAAGGKAVPSQVQYPAGKLVKDKLVGDYQVYAGTVTIPVALQQAPNTGGPVDVSVSIQACNDKSCLQPATLKVSVP
jgi:DsbC/DsbD-like thiol-disulfide interchange protein